jgi:hypothetical protein
MAGHQQRNEEFVSSHETLCQRQLAADEREGEERQQADEFARQLGGNGLPDAISLNASNSQATARRLAQEATDPSRDETDADWEQDSGKLAREAVHV